MKKRWTNIRDYYRKEVQNNKKVPTGSAAKKSKTYVYSELLYFLTPIFAKRVSEGNYPQEKEEDSESNQTPNIEHNIEPEAINYMESPKPTLPVVKQKRKKDVPSEILNMLQQKQKQTPASTDEDDDTKYLLSFRSYMKTMNAQQKIDFKVGMLNLVKTVTMENYPSPPQSRYTNYYHHRDNSSGPKNSPIYLQSPSPPSPIFHSYSQQQNDPRTNTSRKPIVIHSITNMTPPQSTTQQSPGHDYPELSIPETSAENSEAAQFVLQSEDSQKDSIQEFLKLK